MLHVEKTAIPDVRIITVKKFGDQRGFFSEVYNRKNFAAVGIDLELVQDNHAFSADRGTLRGLHFQSAPFGQDTLVRVTRGRILDVAVDIRHASPTFGQHVAVGMNVGELIIKRVDKDRFGEAKPRMRGKGRCSTEPPSNLVLATKPPK